MLVRYVATGGSLYVVVTVWVGLVVHGLFGDLEVIDKSDEARLRKIAVVG